MLVQLPKVHEALMKVLVSIYLFFRPKISTLAQLPSLPFSMQRACVPLRLIPHLLLCEDKDKLVHGVLLFRLLFSIRTSNKNAFKMLMKLMKARSRKQLTLLTVSGRFVLHFNYRWARTKTLIRIAPYFGSTSLSFAVWTSFQCLILFPFYFSFWFYSRCFNAVILSLWKTGLSDWHETRQVGRWQGALIHAGGACTRLQVDKHFCAIYAGRWLPLLAFWSLGSPPLVKWQMSFSLAWNSHDSWPVPQLQIWLMVCYRAFACNARRPHQRCSVLRLHVYQFVL